MKVNKAKLKKRTQKEKEKCKKIEGKTRNNKSKENIKIPFSFKSTQNKTERKSK